MGNERIYIVGKEFGKANKLFAKQRPLQVLHGMALLVKHSWTWQPGTTLYLPVMCSTRGLVANFIDSSFEAWLFTDLSHSSLTNKSTYIQGKLLKKLQ